MRSLNKTNCTVRKEIIPLDVVSNFIFPVLSRALFQTIHLVGSIENHHYYCLGPYWLVHLAFMLGAQNVPQMLWKPNTPVECLKTHQATARKCSERVEGSNAFQKRLWWDVWKKGYVWRIINCCEHGEVYNSLAIIWAFCLLQKCWFIVEENRLWAKQNV